MATWAKVKFFWDNVFAIAGGTLTATSTASGYDAANITNMLEVDSWKAANTTTPGYITIDTGSVDTQANALVIYGHNLYSIGVATIGVHYSTDNFIADINDAFTPFAPASDDPILKEFTSPGGKRYWRFYYTGTITAAPEIKIAVLCNKTELDYASASFDPLGQSANRTVNISGGGYTTGIYTRYVEREMSLTFQDVAVPDGWDSDPTNLFYKINDWWNRSGANQVIVAWETANSSNDIFLMYPDENFNNPLTQGGAYRDIIINLKGRKA